MALAFPILNQSYVFLKVNNENIKVAMLPITAIDTLSNLQDKTIKAIENNNASSLAEIKQEMLEVAYNVVPKDIELSRLKIEQLLELLAYLIYGEEDEVAETNSQEENQEDDNYKKKVE